MTAPLDVVGTGDGEEERRWFVQFYQQWSALVRRNLNWYDFTVVLLCTELAAYTGRWELEVGVVGFQLTLTYVYDHTFNRTLKSEKDRLMCELEARTGLAVRDPAGVLDRLDAGAKR